MLYNMACSSSDEIETLCELMRRKCSNIKTDISDTDVNCDRNTCQYSHSHQTENPCQHVESLSPELVNDDGNYYILLNKETREFLRKTKTVEAKGRGQHVCTSDCQFCRRNGENALFYQSHCLKDAQNIVRCPILRRYKCPKCGATGDKAHTISYCPFSADPNSPRALEKASRLGCGCLRSTYHYCR
jgi:hypothetical protein